MDQLLQCAALLDVLVLQERLEAVHTHSRGQHAACTAEWHTRTHMPLPSGAVKHCHVAQGVCGVLLSRVPGSGGAALAALLPPHLPACHRRLLSH